MVAYKKRKALIIIIIPILALYNMNLLTELNWEWRQIRHVTVKKYCVIIYGIRTFPLDISPWPANPGQLPPTKFSPRKLPPRLLTSG